VTDYITIYGVRKRDFTIQARMPELSNSEINIENYTGEPILWDDNTDIQWDDNTQVLWSTNVDAHPRIVSGVRKRSFTIHSGKR